MIADGRALGRGTKRAGAGVVAALAIVGPATAAAGTGSLPAWMGQMMHGAPLSAQRMIDRRTARRMMGGATASAMMSRPQMGMMVKMMESDAMRPVVGGQS